LSGTISVMPLLEADPSADRGVFSINRARAGVLLGLLFLAGPLADLLGSSRGPAHEAALLLGLALFVGLYVSLLPPSSWLTRLGPKASLVALALLPVIATALLAGGAPTSFAALFVYFVAAAGLSLYARAAIAVTLLTAFGVGLAGLVHGDSGGAIAATVLTIVSIGVLMTAFGRIARANRELRATREEVARLAVSDERLRIARDVHDLLGHSLSVIALKSELAHNCSRAIQSGPRPSSTLSSRSVGRPSPRCARSCRATGNSASPRRSRARERRSPPRVSAATLRRPM
jgi:signal transduction histidine kinase